MARWINLFAKKYCKKIPAAPLKTSKTFTCWTILYMHPLFLMIRAYQTCSPPVARKPILKTRNIVKNRAFPGISGHF